jgi:DNA invertase Pin-like site-specific DNA recombinase
VLFELLPLVSQSLFLGLRLLPQVLQLLSEEKEKAIRQLKREGKPVAEIARVVGLSRPTIYKAIG